MVGRLYLFGFIKYVNKEEESGYNSTRKNLRVLDRLAQEERWKA